MQTNWGTFSACVDEVISRSGRLDRLHDAVEFVYQSILECQTRALFHHDFVEDRLLTTGAIPFMRAIPDDWRQMKAVRYTDVFTPRNKPVYAKRMLPSVSQGEEEYFWYVSGGQWVFAGAGSMVDIAYYRFLPRLGYYAADIVPPAPATFDALLQMWTYNPNSRLGVGGSRLASESPTPAQERAELLVTNWLLKRYFNVIVQGALSKLWNVTQDARATVAFASYQQGQTLLVSSEGSEETSG